MSHSLSVYASYVQLKTPHTHHQTKAFFLIQVFLQLIYYYFLLVVVTALIIQTQHNTIRSHRNDPNPNPRPPKIQPSSSWHHQYWFCHSYRMVPSSNIVNFDPILRFPLRNVENDNVEGIIIIVIGRIIRDGGIVVVEPLVNRPNRRGSDVYPSSTPRGNQQPPSQRPM